MIKMANYALIKGTDVVNVIVVDDSTFLDTIKNDYDHIIELTEGQSCGPGHKHIDGYLVLPQPFPSWTLVNGEWTSPAVRPDDGKDYRWDEKTKGWVNVIPLADTQKDEINMLK